MFAVAHPRAICARFLLALAAMLAFWGLALCCGMLVGLRRFGVSATAAREQRDDETCCCCCYHSGVVSLHRITSGGDSGGVALHSYDRRFAETCLRTRHTNASMRWAYAFGWVCTACERCRKLCLSLAPLIHFMCQWCCVAGYAADVDAGDALGV